MIIKKSYTFKDVLLEPKFTNISASDTSVETRLSRNIRLNVPIVSANMDDVTECEMARFMAKNGGIGIIHRFLPIEVQADEVRKVKRTKSTLIDNPYTVAVGASVREAEKIMEENKVSRLPVIGENGKLAGIITKDDILYFLGLHENGYVSEAIAKKVITGGREISLDQAKKIMCTHHIKALPLVDKDNRLNGLITLKDINEQNIKILLKDQKGRLVVGAAIGIKKDDMARAKALLDAGADVLVIDTAHGHNQKVFDLLKALKRKFAGVDVICGNVATAKAVRDLIKLGADAVKVGIGPGAACTTRDVTGVGVLQLTAIMNSVLAAKKSNVPIIADGGISDSDDLAKALAAGASSVMLGSLLAGTDESPGEIIRERGKSYKRYRGMASRDAAEEKARIDGLPQPMRRVPEGESGYVLYKGSASRVLEELIGGLRDSMYYLGAKDLKAFHKNASFRETTGAGIRESQTRLDKV